MRKFTLLLLTLAIAVSLTTVSLSMVVVTDLTTLTPASLVNTLLGPGVAFSAETYVGDPSAGGRLRRWHRHRGVRERRHPRVGCGQ